jgi:hypothetical protein
MAKDVDGIVTASWFSTELVNAYEAVRTQKTKGKRPATKAA